MSYLSLPFGLIRKEEKIKLDLSKNYGASQYIKRLPSVSREDVSFQNSIIDIVNNRSDLRKFFLATRIMKEISKKTLTLLSLVETSIRLLFVEYYIKKIKVFLSHQHHLA